MTRSELARAFTAILDRAVHDVQELAHAQGASSEHALYTCEVVSQVAHAAYNLRSFIWD